VDDFRNRLESGNNKLVMASLLQEFKGQDEIRLSKADSQVYWFYRDDGAKRWVCAVAKRSNGEGSLITAYRTSAIKEGALLWQK
jgi:hypothetical protein